MCTYYRCYCKIFKTIKIQYNKSHVYQCNNRIIRKIPIKNIDNFDN